MSIATSEKAQRTLLNNLLASDVVGDAYIREHRDNPASRPLCGKVLRSRGEKLSEQGLYEDAARTYLQAAELYTNAHLPTTELYCKEYRELSRSSEWHADAFDVMACYIGAARALMNMKEYTQALVWLAEADSVSLNVRYDESLKKPSTDLWDWKPFHIPLKSDFMHHFDMHRAFAEVYTKLGNTGTTLYHYIQAEKVLHAMVPQYTRSQEAYDFMAKVILDRNAASGFRHPEPSLVNKLEVLDDKSHVLGSWRKLEVKNTSGGLGPRQGTSCFVHKGYLYVAGGQKCDGPNYNEFWRINLTKLDKWQRLEDVPPSMGKDHNNHGFAVTADAAFYFTGAMWVHYYDLRTQRWQGLVTDPRKSGIDWPFFELDSFCMECVGGIIYIFGGCHSEATLGSNFMLEFEPTKSRWAKLSGEFVPRKPDCTLPSPRHSACSWVSKDKKKIYLLYGDANRLAAQMAKQVGASENYRSWSYSDFWSWDIPTKKWTREKLVGNVPSPRSEMACVYNPVIDRVITFGGYCPSTPVTTGETSLTYSYFADTFMCEVNDGWAPSKEPASERCIESSALVDSQRIKWRQVLTRGFPTYRAMAHLLVDESTGKTYLFSGYVNTEVIPSRKTHVSRGFSDIWELRLNVPGGHFDGVDLKEEARTASAGPWKRCFTCGSAGQWKRCGGSCNGRVYFCSTQCLKEAWKEHKTTHNCSKVP